MTIGEVAAIGPPYLGHTVKDGAMPIFPLSFIHRINAIFMHFIEQHRCYALVFPPFIIKKLISAFYPLISSNFPHQ